MIRRLMFHVTEGSVEYGEKLAKRIPCQDQNPLPQSRPQGKRRHPRRILSRLRLRPQIRHPDPQSQKEGACPQARPKPVYDQVVIIHIKAPWLAMDQMCSLKLRAAIALWMVTDCSFPTRRGDYSLDQPPSWRAPPRLHFSGPLRRPGSAGHIRWPYRADAPGELPAISRNYLHK